MNEMGTSTPGKVGKHSYKSEGIQCLIYCTKVEDSVPLYRYFRGGRKPDHFYTTHATEIGTTTNGQTGKYGFRSEGIAGYCFPKEKPGTIPLYRYYQHHAVDHFYTTNADEIGTVSPGATGKYGYVSEGIQCYVLPYYG